jgi:hypothetical protein
LAFEAQREVDALPYESGVPWSNWWIFARSAVGPSCKSRPI